MFIWQSKINLRKLSLLKSCHGSLAFTADKVLQALDTVKVGHAILPVILTQSHFDQCKFIIDYGFDSS